TARYNSSTPQSRASRRHDRRVATHSPSGNARAHASASAFQYPIGSRSRATRPPSGNSDGNTFPSSAQPTTPNTSTARPPAPTRAQTAAVEERDARERSGGREQEKAGRRAHRTGTVQRQFGWFSRPTAWLTEP